MKQFLYQSLRRIYLSVKMPILRRLHRRHVAVLTTQTLEALSALPTDKPALFYLGVTNHRNLGDLAQHYCILTWIAQAYADHTLVKVESDVVVEQRERFMPAFQSAYKTGDIIVFQSGYTTQDLGGNHEEMHRIICDAMPQARILMMPQTIYFRSEANRARTAASYNKAHRMLFLARDGVSFSQAEQMFPDIATRLFPDIVTSLIGAYRFDYERGGVCLCVRNDGEKLYTKAEIKALVARLRQSHQVVVKDTQSRASLVQIRQNLKQHIEAEIASYAHYRVTITDRYHGTIFSLIAGTPVVILQTTDYKVTTGANWFKGIYDDHVFVAQDLQDAHRIAQKILQRKDEAQPLTPYFADHYYAKLKAIFEAL